MRLLQMLMVAAALVAVPAVASATVLTDLVLVGDCEGWTLQAYVHWGWSTLEASFDYAVTLTDLDGNVLEEFVWAGVVSREAGSPTEQVYEFSGVFEGEHVAPGFVLEGMAHLVGPNNDTTLTTSIELDCPVAVDEATWSTIKAIYR